MSVQPAMQSDKGVIVTVSILCGADRTAIVIPLATDDGGLAPESICVDAVAAVQNTVVPLIQDCLSADASVMAVAAEGMMDGTIPFRRDFPVGFFAGNRGAGLMPSQVTGLAIFYGDPADIGPGLTMRCGKTFMPGLCSADVVVDTIVGALEGALEAFAAALLNGFNTNLGGGKWYRVLAKAASTSIVQALRRTIVKAIRKYVATQRRRLVPHT